jgi:protein-S-isoprenylcysteine O-methyltransferase Ste14
VNDRLFFDRALLAYFVLSALVFAMLMVIVAPYGRHSRGGYGPTLDARVGWVLMELPAAATIFTFFIVGGRFSLVSIVFIAMWEIHYLQRTLIFPFLLRGGTRMAVAVMLSGVVFNVWNGYINGRWLFHFAPDRDASWLLDPRFLVGAAIFFAGFTINLRADSILRNLRKPGESGYKIPYGGLYKFISCPNYFGEIVEWSGFALATWSIPAAAFVVWSFANLAPRARAHHRWYHEKFPDYPKERRALLPFLW